MTGAKLYLIKKWLREYKLTDAALKRLERQITELRESLCSVKRVTNISGAKSQAKNDFSYTVDKIIDLEDLYTEKWDKLIDLRIEIEKAVESLPIIEQTLIQLKYIDGYNWIGVCNELGYEWAQTHRIHSRALQKLAAQKFKDDMK